MRWTAGAVVLLAIAAIMAVGFAMLMLRPLSWSHPVQMISVVPNQSAVAPNSSNRHDVGTSAFASWPISDGVDPDHMSADTPPIIGTVKEHRIDAADAVTDEFADRLCDVNPAHPLVLRLSGVLDTSDQHANLWTPSNLASPGPINCSRIVNRLRYRVGPSLLWIEARLPDDVQPEQYPESDAWEFQTLLKKQLLQQRTASDPSPSLTVVIDYTRLQSPERSTLPVLVLPQDTNGNGLWECSEWLAALTPHDSGTQSWAKSSEDRTRASNATLNQRVVWTAGSNGEWDFPIAPTTSVQTWAKLRRSTVNANTALAKDTQPETPPTETPPTGAPPTGALSNSAETIDATAPLMAMAAWSEATQWPTRDAADAVEWTGAWRAALNATASDKAARLWLATHVETASHWREIRFANRVIDRSFSWSVRRDLLLGSHDIEHLATTVWVDRPFQSRWQDLRRRWGQLQRRGLLDESEAAASDSELDPIESRRLRTAARELRSDCEVLRNAHRIVHEFGSDLSRWVNWPIPDGLNASPTRVPDFDPSCQVLALAVVLRRQLGEAELESSLSVAQAVTDLQARIASTQIASIRSTTPRTIKIALANACRQQRSRYVSQWHSLKLEPIIPATKTATAERLESFAKELAIDLRGGSSLERAEGQQSLQQLQTWIKQLGLSSSITMPRQIELTCQGYERLSRTPETTIRLTARALDGEPLRGAWKLDGDPAIWEIIRASHSTPQPTSDSDANQLNPIRSVQVRLKKLALPTSPQWLRCHFDTDTDSYSLNLPLLTAMQPIAAVQWTGADPTCLLPNTTSPIGLQIRALDRSFTNASIRLLARKNPLAFQTSATLDETMPAGTFTGSLASKATWDESTAIVLAELASFPISSERMSPVAFPTVAVDPQMPAIDTHWLRLEIRDLDSPRVQCVDISPAVGRPMAWLQPEVRFDHRSQKVTIAPQWIPDPDPTATQDEIQSLRFGAKLEARLIDPDTDRTFARASVVFDAGQWPEMKLSSAATERPFDVVIDALGWQHAFRYRIDPKTTAVDVPVSLQIHGIAWHDESATAASPNPKTQTKTPIVHEFGPTDAVAIVAVNACLTDSEFAYGQDQIAVGIDLNQNRYLDDREILATANTPVRTEFNWAGVDALGRIQIQNTATPQQFEIPLSRHKNRRIDLLGELRRGTSRWSTQQRPCVIDHQAPRITKAVPSSGRPHQSTQPVTLMIDADDDGLTGVQRVDAGWAMEGRLEFTEDVKTLPAGRQSDGRWAVTLPTTVLPTGIAIAMVRAVDRVGNVSEIETVTIHLQTAAEIDAIRNQPTSSIQGKVSYVNEPVAKMTVHLQRISHDDATQDRAGSAKNVPPVDASQATPPTGGKSAMRTKPMEVVTDTSGRFLFPKVSPGRYRLTVDGLYRGVRRRESVAVVVPGHQMVQVPDIQIR